MSGTMKRRNPGHTQRSSPPLAQDDIQSPLSPISPWPPLIVSSDSSHRQDERTAGDTNATNHVSHSTVDPLPSAKEIYGLVTIILTSFAYALYLVWAFLPASYLESIGWTWFPDQEWAIITPCYLMVIVLLAYWSYSALTPFLTPGFTSPSLITDKFAGIPAVEEKGERYYWGMAEGRAAEAVDLPIGLVNRVLYPPRPRLMGTRDWGDHTA